jgi:hypothetical protein
MIDGPNMYVYATNSPINFVDPYGLYKYDTSNWFIAFVHESNPFNSDGGFYQQALSIGKFLGGDPTGAAAISGQSIVEKTDVCGERSVWQNAYIWNANSCWRNYCRGSGSNFT